MNLDLNLVIIMMKRVIKSFLLLLLMLPWVNVATFAAEETFTDVAEDNKFYEYIQQVSDAEIVNGYSDGLFKPDEAVTRGQFAKMVIKAFEIPIRDDCESFSDVTKENKFYEYIITLKCYQLVSGYSDGRYGVDDTITRGQAAKMLYILGKAIDEKNFPITRSIQLFEDLSHENSMYYYIDAIVSVELEDGARIMSGYSNGKFGPDEKITRGQVAKVIVLITDYIIDGGSYNPLKSSFYNTFSDEVVEGTVTEDDEYSVEEEYAILSESSKSRLQKPENMDQAEYSKHLSIWNSFADVIPFQLTKYLNRMVVIAEHDGIAAAVGRDFGGDVSKFVLIVNQNELEDGKITNGNAIHESAHLLTLSDSQINIADDLFDSYTEEKFKQRLEEEKQKCKTYFVMTGCATNDSYLYQFYKLFWENKIEEFNAVRESEAEESRRQFYLNYNNEFVSTYAMFGIEEDIAESFLYFVYFDKPKDNKSTVNQKINFFYKYPEIVKLRNEIRKRIGA